MDKVNEAIEVSEQETPFHLLPQEEQQHIIDANRKGYVRHKLFMNGISGYLQHLHGQ